MELTTIQSTSSWGEAAAAINQNNAKISTEVEKAKNSSTRAKGLFASAGDLQARWPSPQVGDWAIVGNTVPGTVYQCKTAGTWSNTGQGYTGMPASDLPLSYCSMPSSPICPEGMQEY